MEYKDRIKEARKYARLTQSELASRVGIDQTSISNLERGKSAGSSFSARIARACGVNPVWLEAGTGQMLDAQPSQSLSNATLLGPLDIWDDDTPLEDDEVYVPFLKEVELSAGTGKTVVQPSHRQRLRFGKITLRRQNVQPSEAVCVSVSGNSMDPVLPDGSTVGVDQGATQVIDGKMYAIDHDGQLRVKTLYRLPGGGVRMRSFNRDEHPDEEYSAQQMLENNIVIIGKVFWYSVLL